VDRRLYSQLRDIESSHWWFRGRRRILLAALDRLAVEAGDVLDVGCGAGTTLELLAERFRGARLLGIDRERDPLRFCRADRAAPVVQADAECLPFAAGCFDLVLALDALEHFADDAAALAEAHRVLRPGGVVVATVPAFGFLWGNVDDLGHHHRRYRRAGLLARVEAAGFQVRLVRYFNTLLFAPIAAVRLSARAFGRRARRADEPIRSDFDLVKRGPVNDALAALFGLESRLLGLPAPFGVSLLVVAERPAGGRSTPGTVRSREPS
jgi:SAM-dependent methyltransferase